MSNQLSQSIIPLKADGLYFTVLPDGRWLIQNPASQHTLVLSALAGILWKMCDGQTAVSGLVRQLGDLYPDIPADQLESEATRHLRHFLDQGLVTRRLARTI